MSQQTYMTRHDGVGISPFDSINWVLITHMGMEDTGEFNYAVLYGNEDAPERVELWRTEPKYNSPADYVWPACQMCSLVDELSGPYHDGSKRCESGSIASGGTNAHCSCDTCF